MSLGRPINDFLRGATPGNVGSAPMLNLAKGGMWGALPDYASWVNNAPYVQGHSVFRLIRQPGVFKHMTDGDIRGEFLKNLVEIKRKRIEGVNINVEMSFSELDMDGSGRMMHTPSDSKRATSDLSMTWDELQGMPVSFYWKDYCSMFLVNPDTKKALVSSLYDLPDLLPDMISFAGIFYETDPTNRHVIKAALIDNIMPDGHGGIIELAANKSAEMEAKEVTVSFKNFVLDTTEVYEQAQLLHDEISRTLIDPNRARMGIDGIEADIARISSGYKETLEEMTA